MRILWSHKHRANWVRDTDKIFETELDRGSQYWHQLQKELDRYHFWKKELSTIQSRIIETKGSMTVIWKIKSLQSDRELLHYELLYLRDMYAATQSQYRAAKKLMIDADRAYNRFSKNPANFGKW